MNTLLPFQEIAVARMRERNFLLADDCGLGKTLSAIEAAKTSRGPHLVICPRSVKPWWVQEIDAQAGGFVRATKAAGRGIPYELLDGWQRRCEKPLWVVTHPEAVRIGWKDLQKVHWDWIIADEAHRFKNRKAKQSKALWKVACNRRVALTATPYGKSPADLWALLHWLYPKEYTSYWKFFGNYVESYQPWGQKYHVIKGPKNLSRLAEEVAPFYLKRTKEEELDLPSFTEIEVPVVLETKQAALYKRLRQEAYAEFKGQEVVLENALVRLLRLQQCALDPNCFLDKWEGWPGKVAWLVEWVADHPEEPVVIVSRYRKFVERWLRDFAPASCIVGGMPQYKIKAALEAFEETGILVGSLAAICEGMNLQRANTMIVCDGTYSLVQSYQLTQRIHRIGQDKPCQVLHLVGEGTVDGLLRIALKRKWDQARILDTFIKEVQDGD